MVTSTAVRTATEDDSKPGVWATICNFGNNCWLSLKSIWAEISNYFTGTFGEDTSSPRTETASSATARLPELSHARAREMLDKSFYGASNDPVKHVEVARNADGTYTYTDGAGNTARAAESREELAREQSLEVRAQMSHDRERANEPPCHKASFVCNAQRRR